jgi:hypothetical protein
MILSGGETKRSPRQLPVLERGMRSRPFGHVTARRRALSSQTSFRGNRAANLLYGLAPGHHSTGEWSRLSALTIKAVASLKSFTVAPDQYPVVQVPVSQLPPSVIHSPVRNTSHTQIAFFELDGSTVQRLSRHQVQGVPLVQRSTFLPCLNCSSENAEYTVRIPLASVPGWVVLHGTEDMLAPSSTSQKQIALVGSPGCGMHKADVQSAY